MPALGVGHSVATDATAPNCGTRYRAAAMPLVSRPARRFGSRPIQLPWLPGRLRTLRLPRNLVPLLLAVAVGIAAGLGAVALEAAVEEITTLFNDLRRVFNDLAGGWTLIVVLAIAALPVALIVSRVSAESRGSGVPPTMIAVETTGGFVRPIVAPAKLIATAFTIGGGGSAGREGPIVLIAASLSSTIGRISRQPSDMLVLVVAGGAAGGIAATFNTPIAGTFFALEVVLRRFNVRNFTIVVVSAVVANFIAILFYGDEPELGLPSYVIENGIEVALLALVGLGAALLGVFFVRTRFFTEDLFDFLALPFFARPILALAGVGALALIDDRILGSGLDQIHTFTSGDFTAASLGALLALKLFASSLTIGSGASGGAFAPLLFIGAAGGALLGLGFDNVIPGSIGPLGAYAVVGMAAVFAAAARAPMTSLFIVFELTGYDGFLPLMAAVALATALAQLITRDTIYNVRLRRAGLDVREEPRRSQLDELPVASTMRTDTPIVDRTASIQDIANAMSQSRGNVVAVTDRRNRFLGLVSATDVTSAVERNELDRIARDLAVIAPITVNPQDSLRHALTLLVEHDVRQLPVVAADDPARLLGMLTQRDILLEIAAPDERTADQRNAAPTAPVRRLSGAVQIEVNVEPGSPAAGLAVSQLQLPEAAVMTAIHRRGEVVIPRGPVEIEAHDLVVVLSDPEEEGAVRACFAPPRGTGRSQWWFLPSPPEPPPRD